MGDGRGRSDGYDGGQRKQLNQFWHSTDDVNHKKLVICNISKARSLTA
jgi:hypothetical protein